MIPVKTFEQTQTVESQSCQIVKKHKPKGKKKMRQGRKIITKQR